MRENPQNFYRLAKRKTRTKGYIGPFTDDEGKVIEEEPAETLNKEYYKIFLQPPEEEQIQDSYFDSEEDLPNNEDRWLEDIDFTEEDI